MYNSKEFENLSKKLSKRESLSFKQLWKVYVLLIIRPRTDNEYREYLRTKEFECVKTVI